MTQQLGDLEATLDLVRAVDPLRRSELEHPDTDAELRILLANLPDRTPVRRPRRFGRPLVLGAVAAGALAATLIVTNVAGSGEDSGVSSVLVSPARAAEIVANLKRKLVNYPPGELIEWQIAATTNGKYSWNESFWASTSVPYRARMAMSTHPGSSYDIGATSQGVPQIYDPATDTVYEPEVQAYKLTAGPGNGTWTVTAPRGHASPGITLPPADRGTVKIKVTNGQAQKLRSGVDSVAYRNVGNQKRGIDIDPHIGRIYNVTGSSAPSVPSSWVADLKTRGVKVRLDGKSAIEITAPDAYMPGGSTFWFARKTLAPLKEVDRVPRLNSRNGRTGKYDVITSRYTLYRVLKGTAASPQFLSVSAAHPNAKLVVGEAKFNAAQLRLQAP